MSFTDTSDVPSVRSNVDWAAIFAGAAVATAGGLILLGFGAALGLSLASPYDGEGLSPEIRRHGEVGETEGRIVAAERGRDREY